MLVRSIQQVSLDIRIVIIPGEGFNRRNQPFDVPVMPEAEGSRVGIGCQGRYFRVFQGPLGSLLYVNADTLCVNLPDSLTQRIAGISYYTDRNK